MKTARSLPWRCLEAIARPLAALHIHAVRLLASGRAVTEVAFDVGYDSVSAFIAAFKRCFGTTPARYYD